MGLLKSVLSGAACTLILASFSVSYARADLVHYLPFDDTVNANLSNYGTAGGTSTAVQDPFYAPLPITSNDTPPAFPGWSQYFGAHSQNFNFGGRIDISNSASTFNLGASGDSMTISTWVKWDGSAPYGDQGVVSKFDGSQKTGWAFSVTSSGQIKFNFSEAGAGNYGGNRYSTQTVTAGTWTNISMSWQTGVADNNLKFYINGQDAGISQSYTGGALMDLNGLSIRVGNLDGTYLPFNGKVDDVAIFDTVLTHGKLAAISNAPLILGDFTADKMQALFKLYDDASPAEAVTIDGKVWGYTTTLNGHLAGDVFQFGSDYAMQFDDFGNGVMTIPEPASVGILSVGGMIVLRRRRA